MQKKLTMHGHLRVESSLGLIGIAMFGANLNLYTCRITVNFGTLKDDSIKIIVLSIEQFFMTWEPLPKWHQHVLKNI